MVNAVSGVFEVVYVERKETRPNRKDVWDLTHRVCALVTQIPEAMMFYMVAEAQLYISPGMITQGPDFDVCQAVVVQGHENTVDAKRATSLLQLMSHLTAINSSSKGTIGTFANFELHVPSVRTALAKLAASDFIWLHDQAALMAQMASITWKYRYQKVIQPNLDTTSEVKNANGSLKHLEHIIY